MALRERLSSYRAGIEAEFAAISTEGHPPHDIAANFAVGVFITGDPCGGLHSRRLRPRAPVRPGVSTARCRDGRTPSRGTLQGRINRGSGGWTRRWNASVCWFAVGTVLSGRCSAWLACPFSVVSCADSEVIVGRYVRRPRRVFDGECLCHGMTRHIIKLAVIGPRRTTRAAAVRSIRRPRSGAFRRDGRTPATAPRGPVRGRRGPLEVRGR